MGQFLAIHPESPQPRLIKAAVNIIQQGGVIVYPTDSGYAIGCQLQNKHALDRIRQLRKLDAKHNFTLICRDLSDLGTYAEVDNPTFRILKSHTPGAYTFILKASRLVPKRLMHPKRDTIGLRVPDSVIVQSLLEELSEPLMSVTLILPNQEEPLSDARDIYATIGSVVDLVIDGGTCSIIPTTIVDLVEGHPKIIRIGKGDPTDFL